jgi:hypothetical protein
LLLAADFTTGEYTVRVSDRYHSGELPVTLINVSDKSRVITELQGLTGGAFTEKLTSVNTQLILEWDFALKADALSKAKPELGEVMERQKPFDGNEVGAFLRKLDRSAVLALLNKGSAFPLQDYLSLFPELDRAAVAAFSANIGDRGRSAAFTLLSNKSITGVDAFAAAFQNAVIVAQISYPLSGGYGHIPQIIDDNRAYLSSKGFNFTVYDANAKLDFAQKLAGVYASFDALKSAFNAVSFTAPPRGGNSGGNAFGGKGGGTVSGGVVPSDDGGGPTQGNTAKELPFTDLQGVEWAVDALTALSEARVISGTGGGKFEPNHHVTREEAAKMLAGAFGITGGNANFSDVTPDDWYYSYVTALCGAGIVNGLADGRFGAGEAITRQDFAAILYRAAQYGNILRDAVRAYTPTDAAQIADYAAEAVFTLCGAGIISGYEDGSFRPGLPVTRAEAAKLIYGVYRLTRGGAAND